LDGIASSEEVAEAIAHAAIVKAEKQTKEQESKAAFLAVTEALRVDSRYAHLKQGDDSYSGKLAAANIRSALKCKFPGIKFSVRKTDYGSVRVSWTDGPTVKDIEAIVNRFESGGFNGMEDIYEYRETPFNVVFGGCKYLNCSRETSPELVTRAIEKVCELYGIDTDIPTADDFKNGRLWRVHIRGERDLQSLIHQALAEMPA
jgi:hypothetical protein